MKCGKCGKDITDKGDANVIAFLGTTLEVFCNNCYASRERDFGNLPYFPDYPINGKFYLALLVAVTLFVPVEAIIAIFAELQMAAVLALAATSFIAAWGWILLYRTKGKLSSLGTK